MTTILCCQCWGWSSTLSASASRSQETGQNASLTRAGRPDWSSSDPAGRPQTAQTPAGTAHLRQEHNFQQRPQLECTLKCMCIRNCITLGIQARLVIWTLMRNILAHLTFHLQCNKCNLWNSKYLYFFRWQNVAYYNVLHNAQSYTPFYNQKHICSCS